MTRISKGFYNTPGRNGNLSKLIMLSKFEMLTFGAALTSRLQKPFFFYFAILKQDYLKELTIQNISTHSGGS